MELQSWRKKSQNDGKENNKQNNSFQINSLGQNEQIDENNFEIISELNFGELNNINNLLSQFINNQTSFSKNEKIMYQMLKIFQKNFESINQELKQYKKNEQKLIERVDFWKRNSIYWIINNLLKINKKNNLIFNKKNKKLY